MHVHLGGGGSLSSWWIIWMEYQELCMWCAYADSPYSNWCVCAWICWLCCCSCVLVFGSLQVLHVVMNHLDRTHWRLWYEARGWKTFSKECILQHFLLFLKQIVFPELVSIGYIQFLFWMWLSVHACASYCSISSWDSRHLTSVCLWWRVLYSFLSSASLSSNLLTVEEKKQKHTLTQRTDGACRVANSFTDGEETTMKF